MPIKKSVGFFLLLILLIPFLLSAGKEDKYERWLKEEVILLLTDEEKAEFEKIKSDKERDQFIELFWAKRDPTPQTERNEFKEEYYRRLKYVQKAFIYRYKTGVETDMGKVYLLFGKPKISRQGNFEVWIYPTQEWMNLPKQTFSIVFGHDGIGHVIDRSQTDFRALQAFYDYPKKILLYPDLEEVPEYKKVMTFSPESFEGNLIQQIVDAPGDKAFIPFEAKTLFIKAENLSSYMTILLKVAPMENREVFKERLFLFGRLESEGYSSDFRQERRLVEEGDSFVSYVGCPVLPGECDLYFGFYTKDKKIYSMRRDRIEVPNFWTQELALSSLLVSSEVLELKAPPKKDKFSVFSLGRYSIVPCFLQEYTQEDFLNLFYYVYNVAADEDQNCSLLIELEFKTGEKKFKLNPQRKKQKLGESTTILEGTRIPLSALPITGEYELTVTVTDEIAKTSASEKIRFTLR